MFKNVLKVNHFIFWILAGFFVFFFFWKTSEGDLNHIPKLVAEGVLIFYAAIYIFLSHNVNYRWMKEHRVFALLLVTNLLYIVWITFTNTAFSSAPSYTLLGWTDWYSGYFLYVLCMMFFLLPAISIQLKGFNVAIQAAFWLSIFTAALCIIEYVGFDIFLSNRLLQSVLHYKFTPGSAVFPILSVGNSGYIGSIWLLFLPLPIFLIQQGRRKQALIWWLALSLGLASTHSKISTIVAIVFFIFTSLYFLRATIKKISAFFIFPILITAFGTAIFQDINSILAAKGIVTRSVNQNFDVAGSFKDRLYIWEGSLNAWKARPLTGWGLETLQNVFFDYVSRRTLDHYGEVFAHKQENENVLHFGNLLVIVPKNGQKKILREAFTFNVKPHNYFIEELYGNGIVGLILLLSFYSSVAFYCLRSGSRESILLILGFGMYLVYLCGWFITIAVSPLAFILLGFAVHLATTKKTEDRQLKVTNSMPKLPDTV